MRIEKDCIGEMFVPDNVLYGIHSLRAKHNFPITNEKVDPAIIQSYLQIKKAAAIANEKAGRNIQDDIIVVTDKVVTNVNVVTKVTAKIGLDPGIFSNRSE